MTSKDQGLSTTSDTEVNPLGEWTTVVFGEDLVDRIVAHLRRRRPATALFCFEEWAKRSRKDKKALELELEDRTGCRFETLLIKIYNDLDNSMMSEVINKDFNLKRIITEVTSTPEVHIQSLNTQGTLLLSPSGHTSRDMWKTELEDLDDMMACWTPITFQDTSKSGFEHELQRMTTYIDDDVLKEEEASTEWLKGCRVHKEFGYFLSSMLEALELFTHPESIEVDHTLQKWIHRGQILKKSSCQETHLRFLNIQKVMLTNLELKNPLKELLLEKIKLTSRQHNFNSAQETMHLLEYYSVDSSSSEVDKFRSITSLVHIEKGRMLWEQGRASCAIQLAKSVIKEIKDRCRLDSWSFDAFSSIDGEVTSQQLHDAAVLCKWLCCLGEWIFLSKLESFDSVIEHMNNVDLILSQPEFKDSTEALKIKGKFHYKFACYADQHYLSLLSHIEAMESKIQPCTLNAKQVELDRIRSQVSNLNISLNEEYKVHAQLDQEAGLIEESLKDLKDMQGNRDQCLVIALEHYFQSLEISDDKDLKITSRVLQLWFKNNHSEAVNEIIGSYILTIPSFKFLPLANQIVSRITNLASDRDPAGFLTILHELVWKLCEEHPYHTVPIIIALRNEGLNQTQAPLGGVFGKIFDYGKTSKARELVAEFKRDSERLKGIIPQMDLLIDCYVKIAEIYKNLKADQLSTILFPPQFKHQVQDLDLIPILSTELPVQPSGVYEFEHFKSFGEKIYFKKGLSRVTVVQAFDILGREFKEGIKNMNNVHQEAVIQQIFRVANELLLGDIESRKQGLAMQTYKVTPLTPTIGIIQWVENTIQMSEYLIGPDEKSGAHSRYHQAGVLDFKQCHDKMESSFGSDRTQTFVDVCSQFPPVMHHFFIENSTCALDRYKKRNSFIKSVAVSSIMGYIIGLGDRHLENILIKKDTGEVVHIDLGVVFDQGKFLQTPEVVPFRLTQEMVDGMGLYGVVGTMTKCCELTLNIMRENQNCLEMICDVFFHNTLSTWTLHSHESQSLASKLGYNLGEQLHDHPEYKATRIIRIISQKLQGVGEGRILSVEGQVRKLIQEAQDPNKLSKMRLEWAPWL